jgi:hypothetical protein
MINGGSRVERITTYADLASPRPQGRFNELLLTTYRLRFRTRKYFSHLKYIRAMECLLLFDVKLESSGLAAVRSEPMVITHYKWNASPEFLNFLTVSKPALMMKA